MNNKKLKNGVELLLSLALSLDLLEQYNANRLLKKKLNMAKNEIEKVITSHYNQLYESDEEFVQNAINFKEKLIKMVAKYNEPDCLLAIDFLNKFDENIEIARKKGVVMFDKLM